MMATWSRTDDLLKPLKGLRVGLGLLLIAVTASAAEDEKRIALVVGVATYSNAPPLLKPTKDAQALGDALRKLGFDVDLQLDLDNRSLSSALRSFGVRAADADVALVYFAGHGVQVDGTNYLIPADARLERVRDLLYEAIPLQLFLGEISQAREIGIMLLDACRDNPFVDRLSESMGAARTSRIGQGLNRIDDTPSGTMVAMATRANVVAEDGTGEHSPYAQALLTELQVPGLELGLFFRRVRDQVMEMTQGRQEPYTFGSVGATPFYFNPKPPNRAPIVVAAAPLTVLDDAGMVDLAIPAPSDPDKDHLVVQVTGLPRGGAVLVGDRPVLIGDYLTVEQLRSAAFRPDRSAEGDVGTFAYLVSDGQGGSTGGAVAITINPSNHRPHAHRRRRRPAHHSRPAGARRRHGAGGGRAALPGRPARAGPARQFDL
jgi:Caspase domain